jgi:DNA-binding CsgD family transcriptional regulator/tetratricopeptide (TPR) repeat protein
MLSSRFAESLQLARQAIDLAQQLEDGRSIEGHARCNLGVDLARLGHLDEGVAELLEARRIAEEQFDDVDDIARSLVNLLSVYDDAGRLSEAVAVGLESITVVDKLGLLRRKGVWCRCETSHALLLLGRHDEALRLLDEAIALAPQGVDAVYTDISYGQLMVRLGRFVPAREHLERARERSRDLIDGQLIGPLFAALVEVATLQHDFATARGWAEEGLTRLSPDEDAAYAVPLFAAAVAALVEEHLSTAPRSRDDRVATEQVTRWLVPLQAAIDRMTADTPVAVAHDATARCEVERLSGDPAVEAWTAVVSRWEALSEPYRATYAQLRAVEGLLTTGAERADADRRLRVAWSTADRIGASHLRDVAEALAGRANIRLGDGPVTGSDSPHRLTPRERDVLALVADGLSDRQIGSRLFISHRTVERHVSNLLAKLAAERRSQLTATAHRLGLAGGPGAQPAASPTTAGPTSVHR